MREIIEMLYADSKIGIACALVLVALSAGKSLYRNWLSDVSWLLPVKGKA